ASNSRRPMVTAIRPSRARCVGNGTTPRPHSLHVQGGRMLASTSVAMMASDIQLRRTRPETCSLKVHRLVVTDKSLLDGRASQFHHRVASKAMQRGGRHEQ